MRILIDNRPANNNEPKPYTAIRLYPETNKEMADLEWIMACEFTPEKMIRNCLGEMSYVVTFRPRER